MIAGKKPSNAAQTKTGLASVRSNQETAELESFARALDLAQEAFESTEKKGEAINASYARMVDGALR